MFKKILIFTILLVLAYGFWISPDFKEIAAGVAIFLFGMISLEEGFNTFTGGTLERILKKSTDKQWKSVGFGIATTTIMQSSSLVSVITISFLSAGLLGLAAGIGIIFGANIGTTTGAWLVAGLGLKVKISAYAMPMLVFGVVLLLQKQKNLKGFGFILAGLGFLFLGISYMKSGFEAFKDTIDLAQFAMEGFAGLMLFSLIGIAATVIMQSSHATMVLIITALAAGQITYENSLALAIGANVGTTVTAVIGAMSAAIPGKRLAAAHLIFNMVTGLVAIVFLQQFLVAVNYSSEVLGIANDDYTLKLAVFHTLFNTAGVVIMWPFVNKMVIFLENIFKEPTVEGKGAIHLHNISVDFPETAVEAVRKETAHMYQISTNVLCEGLSLNRDEVLSDKDLELVVKNSRTVKDLDIDGLYETEIKGIYSEIIKFISKASFTWEVEQSSSIHWLRSATQNIVESVKAMKHLRKNMSQAIVHSNKDLQEQYDLMRLMIARIIRELDGVRIMIRVENDDQKALMMIQDLKQEIQGIDQKFYRHITSLLQDKKITAHMATSLMNDGNYTLTIASDIISMAETLYAVYNEQKEQVKREIILNEE
ncbi:Na/Pi symporter [Thalassotalea sp. Y01]|uniref:Na/Pi cotransporter family protein n=1 Tax=Thalassotalea sp. Y01 TaxID=2729613 RepID=UPI00145C8324|nr:Na/Pi symporter [Thalassotalea sp. Y01]NMP15589.1 Na/Pi cotransporter family protein [Thalassotalea sp. Y01]